MFDLNFDFETGLDFLILIRKLTLLVNFDLGIEN